MDALIQPFAQGASLHCIRGQSMKYYIFLSQLLYLYLFHFCTATSVLKFAGSARITIINVIELFIWLCKTVVMIASLLSVLKLFIGSPMLIFEQYCTCLMCSVVLIVLSCMSLVGLWHCIFCSNASSFLGYDWCFVLSLLKCKFNIRKQSLQSLVRKQSLMDLCYYFVHKFE